MLEGLRPRYRVACLSNTDELHGRQFDEQLHLQDWFDECFYSNESGLRKPDPKAYLHVSKSLDFPPNEIAFHFEVPMVRRNPGIQHLIDDDGPLVDMDDARRFLAAMTRIAFDCKHDAPATSSFRAMTLSGRLKPAKIARKYLS